MIIAAGVLFIADGRVLLLKRARGAGDYADYWGIPGGKVEDGESLAEAARRECIEECGSCPDVKFVPFNVTETVDCKFTTFVAACNNWTPKLNEEHSSFMWAPLDEYPPALHPGLADTLKKLTMTELDVAEGIRDGLYPSPSQFQNITLFAMRITGTGSSYRDATEPAEHVIRDPKFYLTEEFLKRCNGLAVIYEHTEAKQLNTKEFAQRVIGAVMLPYIKGNEVWGIVKIHDADAARLMTEKQLSTSPNVVFRTAAVNKTYKLENGERVVVEYAGNLIDHLAICENGVWDKGGPPSGILLTGVDTMADREEEKEVKDLEKGAEEEKKAATDSKKDASEYKDKKDAKKDAAEKEDMADRIMSKLDALCSRMDAIEAKDKKDAKKDGKKDAIDTDSAEETDVEEGTEGAKDKRDAKKDATNEEAGEASEEMKVPTSKVEADSKKDGKKDAKKDDMDDGMDMGMDEMSRADARRIDAAVAKRLAEFERRLPREMTLKEREAFAEAQSRADSVARVFGNQAAPAMSGESLLSYRRRLARPFQEHSQQWAKVDLGMLPEAALGIAEEAIYADAMKAGRDPKSVPGGGLREIRHRDRSGREISEFVGDPNDWMEQFRLPSRRVTQLFRNPDARH